MIDKRAHNLLCFALFETVFYPRFLPALACGVLQVLCQCDDDDINSIYKV